MVWPETSGPSPNASQPGVYDQRGERSDDYVSGRECEKKKLKGRKKLFDQKLEKIFKK